MIGTLLPLMLLLCVVSVSDVAGNVVMWWLIGDIVAHWGYGGSLKMWWLTGDVVAHLGDVVAHR